MTITVFGATGMTGRRIVLEALNRGHHVRAFGRNVFTASFPESENLELIKGALFDENEVLNALKDSDAVLSAIGGSLDGCDKARSLGMRNIIRQMEQAGIHRIIAVGGMGVLDGPDGNPLLYGPGYPEIFKAVGEEHMLAFRALEESTLNFTFVCCPDIIDEPATGHYHSSENVTPEPNNYRISAGDLADFMLNSLETGMYIRKRAGISN